MAKRIGVEDDPDLGVGYARITIQADGLPAGANQLFIRRAGYDSSELGPAGWQSGEHPLQADQITEGDGQLVLTVGPAVVGYMDRGNYQIEVADASGGDRFRGVLAWKNVTPCAAPGAVDTGGGLDAQTAKTTDVEDLTQKEETPEQEPIEEEETESAVTEEPPTVDEPPIIDPGPTDEPPAQRSWVKLIAIIVGVLVLLGIAGLFAFGLLDSEPTPIPDPQDDEVTTEEPEPAPPPPPPPPPADAFARRDWVSRPPDEQYARGQQFVDTSKEAPNPEELMGHAEWLFDAAKDQGSAEAALALGQLYDPRDLSPDRAQQLPPDLNSAYRAYRQAQQLGSPDADAELRQLRTYVDEQCTAGEAAACSLLRRPWPDQ